MKKLLLLLAIPALFSQSKAQQLLALPGVNSFKPDTGLLFKQFNSDLYKIPGFELQPIAQLKPLTGTIQFYSNMPVVKSYRNADKMPVVVPWKPSEKYPMLIKKINPVNTDSLNGVKLVP